MHVRCVLYCLCLFLSPSYPMSLALPSCLIIQTGKNFACVACACLCLQATKILDTRCQSRPLDEHREKDNAESSPADIIHCYCCCAFWCFACLMCKVVCSVMLTGNNLNIEKVCYSILSRGTIITMKTSISSVLKLKGLFLISPLQLYNIHIACQG